MSQHDFDVMMVFADSSGQIYDHPTLQMVARKGREWIKPRGRDLIPLPAESELFLLPNRSACGFNPETGVIEEEEGYLAVGAFVAPAHTIVAHPAYSKKDTAPMLPLFAYCAVGFANDQFYVYARKVDEDPRQQFAKIPRKAIENGARFLRKNYPKNRLVQHILNNCVARYDCPAARNFALGRFEAPLPSSQTCNARCVGCISLQEKDSPIAVTPQCRLTFTPRADEIAQVMQIHSGRETKTPIFSFGQGCEGDPLQNATLLAESIALFRSKGGHGTINCNTNASNPDAVVELAKAGLTSLRVSVNSTQEKFYTRYYRPKNYSLSDVFNSIAQARIHNIFVSLNLLYFPGITDTEEELTSLANCISQYGVSMIQWRNLNIDPDWYLSVMLENETPKTYGMGLDLFMKRLRTLCPWIRYGYFNPYLGDTAEIAAPMPGERL